MDLDRQKRTIFIQRLNPETTKQSLQDCFSNYPVVRCTVPVDESGRKRGHGIITFQNEESVDEVMSQREHRIDDKEVFIHRSARDTMARSLKDTIGVQQLVVSGVRNQSLIESDIRDYFSHYGEICNINKMENDDNIWIIDFDYYDSVDRILLDGEHRIGKIDVNVKRGHRTEGYRRWSTTDNDNQWSVIPKKLDSTQSACLSPPTKRYCIHITNLPVHTDAETLADAFHWDICDILIDPSLHNRTLPKQCWLKNAQDETEVDEFVQNWNRKTIGGSIIHCEKQEDQLELCNKFQFGLCRKSNGECHWEHVLCTAQGTCGSNCPYGHKFGMKSRRHSAIDPAATVTYYRVKFTGFKTAVTPDNLAQLLCVDSHDCYVDYNDNHVGYVVKIKTMKYVRQLINRWHNEDIDDQKIKCQWELNPRPLGWSNRALSPAASADGKPSYHRSRSRPDDVHSLHSNQETSDVDDTIMSTSFDNCEPDRDKDRRISAKDSQDIPLSLSKTSLYNAPSSESTTPVIENKYRLPSDVPADEWEVTKKASYSDEKVLLIRGKVDRRRLAVIKIYSNQSSDDINREINAMKDLKDVKGISQLVEPEHASNILVQRRAKRDKLWMIMERASGCSLKEFIERKCQGVLEIETAIKLTLNLTEIIQQMHNKRIFHQNLSPENIMIDWDLRYTIDRAQLTILNFSQAVIVSNRTTLSMPSSTQKWYHAPQIDYQRLALTIDPSGICAILFWLLTQIEPSHDNDDLPHIEAHDKIDDAIKSTVNSTKEEQLRTYLIDTFDRAFGYPHYHPWTIHDLQCRLESILQLLMPSEPELNTINDIFDSLISIADSVPALTTTIYDSERDAFDKASQALCQAKKYFVENEKNQYEWLDGHCTWIHRPHSSINECRNDDILIYSSFRGRTTTSYSIIITCLARSSEEGRVMTLFISSNINGKTIEMPIGQYSTAQDYAISVQENFKIELMNILLAIYRQPKLHTKSIET